METFDGVWFYSRKPYKKLHNQRFKKLIILQLTYCRRSKENTFFIRKKNQIIVITNAQEKKLILLNFVVIVGYFTVQYLLIKQNNSYKCYNNYIF